MSDQQGQEWNCKCLEKKEESSMEGGKRRMTKSQYKEYLEKKKVETLRNMSLKKGLNITVTRYGRKKFVKKETLVNNLVNFLFGK